MGMTIIIHEVITIITIIIIIINKKVLVFVSKMISVPKTEFEESNYKTKPAERKQYVKGKFKVFFFFIYFLMV